MRSICRSILPLVCAAASSAAAVEPANNACGQNRAAFTVPSIGGAVVGTLRGATRDGSACAGLSGTDVYFYFTPASVGPWQFSISSEPSFDSVLSIHTDSCPVSPTTYITPTSVPSSCNDDPVGCTGGGCPAVLGPTPITPGTPCIIRVAMFAGEQLTPLNFTLTTVNTSSSGACCAATGGCVVRSVSICTAPMTFLGEGTTCTPNPCPQQPVNDLCAAAIALAGPSADIIGTTALAGTDGGSTCGGGGSRDVWYAFTPETSGAYSLALCLSPGAWASVISVHAACPGNLANQIAGACDDNWCSSGLPGSHAAVPAVLLSGGVTYRIRVAGEGSAGTNSGVFRLTIGPALGTCCRATDAVCWIGPQFECPPTDLWTQGAPCVAGACAALIGACCDPATGVCEATTAAACMLPRVFLGTGLSCNPMPCPQPMPGACCDTTGCCTILIEALCTGLFVPAFNCTPPVCGPIPTNDSCLAPIELDLGTPVFANSCLAAPGPDGPSPSCAANADSDRSLWFSLSPPATAAYTFSTCDSDHDTIITLFQGACDELVEIGCNDDGQPACGGGGGSDGAAILGPIVLTAGVRTLIRVSDGPAATSGGMIVVAANADGGVGGFGACCALDGSCAPTDAANCPAGSVFTQGGICEPNPCPQPTGACCTGSICLTLTADECAGSDTAFAGVGTACNQYPQAVGVCCLADFNHVSGISIQDLFDFLAGYFSGSPAADINRSGANSVQDIFNYLDVYFRGGC